MPFVDGEAHRLRRLLDDPVEVPLLGELADGRRADEEVGLDGDADALRDLDDRPDVVLVRPRRGSSAATVSFCVDDLPRQPLDRLLHVRPGARAGRCRRCRRRSAFMKCRMRIFSSIDGSVTDGDCSPSRSVSSSNSTLPRRGTRRLLAGDVPVVDEQVFAWSVHRLASSRDARKTATCRQRSKRPAGAGLLTTSTSRVKFAAVLLLQERAHPFFHVVAGAEEAEEGGFEELALFEGHLAAALDRFDGGAHRQRAARRRSSSPSLRRRP